MFTGGPRGDLIKIQLGAAGTLMAGNRKRFGDGAFMVSTWPSVAVRGAAALACLLAVAGCTSSGGDFPDPISSQPSGPPTGYVADPGTLTIVAGSEQRSVVETIVQPWCSDVRHITCSVTYLGSVDQARLLESGQADYDAFWFASSVFAQLGDRQHQLQDLASMSVTPIVFAGWKSQMERLGFVGRDVTIAEVLKAVESHKVTTWVTNPTQSNSGASVYLGYLTWFAHDTTGQALTEAQLGQADVQQGITRFVRAFTKTPPSTGTLMDDCIAQPAQCQTMFTYEDLVMERNNKLVAQGKEPLYVVYPKGSLAIADAPLGFLPHNGGDATKKANFDALQKYLLTDPTAQKAMLSLGRRPADITALSLTNAPPDVFNSDWGIRTTIRDQQLAYPAGTVIEKALNDYQDTFRSPADVVYCLDSSGSMGSNGGWEGVDQAAGLLFDPVQSRRYFLQVNGSDRTTVIVFADSAKGQWTVTGNAPAEITGLRDDIRSLSPDGSTAIYDCLNNAATFFDQNPPAGRKRLVILMTDGKNNAGASELSPALLALKVPVVTIAFGSDADPAALKAIASSTHGAFIQTNDLVTALRQATGYR